MYTWQQGQVQLYSGAWLLQHLCTHGSKGKFNYTVVLGFYNTSVHMAARASSTIQWCLAFTTPLSQGRKSHQSITKLLLLQCSAQSAFQENIIYWMFYDHFSAHSLLAKLGRWGWLMMRLAWKKSQKTLDTWKDRIKMRPKASEVWAN